MGYDFNDSDKEKLEKEFLEKQKSITKTDVSKALTQGGEKIQSFIKSGEIPDMLAELWNDIVDMWNLLKDYWNEVYPNVPWNTIAAIAVALLYFASPIDIIPDFIPFVGYIDDFFIITLALKMIKKDLDNYREWRLFKNEKS